MAAQLPASYLAATVLEDGGTFEIKSHPLPKPGRREVLVKILACGVCRTDDACIKGYLGGKAPRVPGHEIVGDVVAVGGDVARFALGDRVGGAFHGGHDGTCSYGGYAEYTLIREEAAVGLPADADPAKVAPLLCAGLTVFNGIRHMKVPQGSVVAVHGIGGLGHMAIQFASKMGYEVVALSSGPSKRDFAKQLGADHYVDMSSEDPVEALLKLGGAAMVLATAPSPETTTPLLRGLHAGGKMVLMAAVGPLPFDSNVMIMNGLSIHAVLVGNAVDAEETVAFALKNDINCLIERFPLRSTREAFNAMMENKVRFRAVLDMSA